MLKYFAEHRDLEQVKSIFAALNRTKDRLQRGEYSAPLQNFDECKHLFDDIKALAIQKNDERLANAQYVFREYFLLFCELMKYWERLKARITNLLGTNCKIALTSSNMLENSQTKIIDMS